MLQRRGALIGLAVPHFAMSRETWIVVATAGVAGVATALLVLQRLLA